MKKIILGSFLTLAMTACSNEKSSNPQEKTIKGSFVGTEVTSLIPEASKGVDERGVFLLPQPIEVKNTVIVQVTDEIYHEYIISYTRTSGGAQPDPVLTESIYKYSQKENGVVELELIADACGVYHSDEEEKKTFKPLVSTNSMITTSGQVVSRVNSSDVQSQIAEIEKNKQENVYDTSCSTLKRKMYNWTYDLFVSDDQKDGATK